MKRKLLLAALCVVGALGFKAQAQSFTEGKYYLQNVESGLFWGAGNSWGTQASLVAHPEYVTLHPKESTYTLESQVSNGGTAYYFNGDFMDNGSPVSLTITASGDYYTIANGTNYYGYDGTSTVLGKNLAADSENAKWRIVSEADMIASLSSASVESPVDATFLLLDPNFGRNNRNSGSWTHSNNGGDFQLSAGDNTNCNMQHWNGTFDLYQTISTLPNGFYRVKAQGYYRDGSNANAASNHAAGTETIRTILYANNETTPLMSVMAEAKTSSTGGFVKEAATGVFVPNSQGNASVCFTDGYYSNNILYVNVTDGTLKIGAKCTENVGDAWTVLDNFTLTYYGTEVSSVNEIILADYIKAYKAALAEAHSYQEIGMFESELASFNAVVSDNTLDLASATAEALATATENLVSANVTAAKNCKEYTTYNTAVTLINGGTNVDLTSLFVNPSFETGNLTGWATPTTGNDTGVKTNPKTAGQTYYMDHIAGDKIFNTWANSIKTLNLTQTIGSLPEGIYEVRAWVSGYADGAAINLDVNGATASVVPAEAGGKCYQIVNQFGIADKGSVVITVSNTGKGNTFFMADDFELVYVGSFPDLTAVDGKMKADVATAQTTALANYNGNRTIETYNAATAAIAAAQASKDAYTLAATALAEANALKTNHNFVSTEAASTFEEAIAAVQTKYDDGTLTDEEATAGGNLGTLVTGHRAGANTAASNYMENTFGLNDFDASLCVNTWSIEGATDGSNFKVPFFEYWIADDNSLGANKWTATLTDLPNGLYEVSAWVRVRAKNGVAATDATGITMDVNGGGEGDYAAQDVTEGAQIGTSQFQIATYTAQNLVKDGKLTLNFNIAADNNTSWLSFKNVKYTKVRDLTPAEEFVAATAEDYAALNAAIASKVLGFEEGEYAPYNNVEAIATIVAAKAIDQTVENDQKDVQAATAAITGATWTANDAEVNAIWDGSFEYEYSTSGNVQPKAWHGVGNLDNATNVRWMWNAEANAGLNATSSNKGLFAKFTFNYGTENGYTLPLKSGYYKLTFLYGGWNEKGTREIKMYANDTNATISPATVTAVDNNAHTTADSWRTYSGIINIPVDDNYVLEFYRQSTSQQNQIVIGDIELVRATAADFKDQLNAEIATANAIDRTANVGDAAFQIPSSAATTLTNAISDAQSVYDDNDATIDGVLQAIDDLKAAETTYSNVELNAPAADKVYNIINVSEGYNHSGKAVTFKSASDADLTGNTTSMGYNEIPGSIYPQGVKFTAVDDVTNGYKLSYTRADGEIVYVGTGSSTGLGNNDNQIRPTTDATKAVTIQVVATSTEGVWNLKNMLANNTIGANGANDQGFYTTAQFNSMKLQEAANSEVALNIAAANQYGTLILPFDAEVPAGVTAYTVETISGSTLTMVEASSFSANTPYIVYAQNGATATLAGLGAAYTDASYTVDFLTGVYAPTAAPVGSYVLQNNGKVGFYEVAENKQPTVGAYRAYLTVPAEQGAKPRAFFFGADDATAIATVAAMTAGEVEAIYTVGGAKVESLQKGLNILKLKNGQTRKVFVK